MKKFIILALVSMAFLASMGIAFAETKQTEPAKASCCSVASEKPAGCCAMAMACCK